MRRAVASLSLALLLLSGCATRTSFQGIPFSGGRDPALAALAARAAGGDRHALLELGIRFEEGRGVPMDWERAADLYRRAAASSGGTMMIYVPPTRPGGTGTVMPVSSGPVIPGLPQARDRLDALRKRRDAGESPRRI